MKDQNEIVINGDIYIKKSSLEKKDNPIVMVRTYSAGVFYGEIVERNGKEVKLHDARRVWYWDGAASLSQLAQSGTTKPENCKFPEKVDEIILTEVIEILTITDTALKILNEVKIWKK